MPGRTAADRPRIALCFYGIPRGLPLTAPSILKQIIAPLQEQAEVLRLGHVFTTSAEPGENVDHDIGRILGLDHDLREAPGPCLEQWGFDRLLAAGDYWDNQGVSLRNLVHQLHSLDQVTQLALDHGVTQCLFLRPDLRYHDSVAQIAPRLLHATEPRLHIPNWQRWKGGMNDRFAWATGQKAIRAWGGRARLMHSFCENTHSPLHSEQLVRFALFAHDLPWSVLPVRASRVRAEGNEVNENFRPRALRSLRQRTRLLRKWKRAGLRRGFATQAQTDPE